MNKITFHCRTITPMFLAGADGKTPELRPPSIKGSLRFWWRAMNGNLGLGELKKREGEIFGSTDGKGSRSKIIIRIKKQPEEKDIMDTLWGNEIQFKKRTSTKRKKQYKVPTEYFGVSYLLYSTFMVGERCYIKNEVSFSFELTSYSSQDMKEAINSVFLLSFLGSLGTRSRRGAGCFRIENITGENIAEYKELFDTSGINSRENLGNFIKEKCDQITNINVLNSSYSILKNTKLYIFDIKTNWKDALEAIGKPFWEFRNINKQRISETPNFGFPISHKNPKTLMGAGPSNIKKKDGKFVDFLDRRSSPLIFKVIKTRDGCFFPVIIWLYGDLIPSNYSIMDDRGNNTGKPDIGIINEFLSLNELNNHVEVTL